MSFDVISYRKTKQVKLSDAYILEIYDEDSTGKTRKFEINGAETKEVLDNSTGEVNAPFHNAISVKLPNIHTASETIKYNIFSHEFLRRDLDASPDTLDVTLSETSDNKARSFIAYLLERTGFNEDYHGSYSPFDGIKRIVLFVLDNKLKRKIFYYWFEDLKLVNYDYKYSYDYRDSSLPTVDLSFSYEEFSFGSCDIPLVTETSGGTKARKKEASEKTLMSDVDLNMEKKRTEEHA